ncbi:hypothetical protein [Cellulomonas sp. P24]|uniref:hypothetical protein n=1 Tax=Cellulomonas sp. P24 TaxID=2885206 RepID=UPI00216B39A9|nr:hypothetical protein [Cellulomonas sp. P24]MCR6491752.1 hypothetical protein [Cellulomonas sp. P24]
MTDQRHVGQIVPDEGADHEGTPVSLGTAHRFHHRTGRSLVGVLRDTWNVARFTSGPSWLEVGLVAALVVAIQVIMFSGYYRGTTSPSGDFLASYNTEAFAWWRDGGIFNPPSWMPYTWGGFPASAQVQNSSWYLPTGLTAWLTPYDIHAAATLQALHVAFGGVGVYVLGRRAGFGRLVASFGLVAYSFTSGFFVEAPYVDIVRGFALAPWIFLCLSPLWPWRRRWSVPIAALLLWQAAVGVYPGALVAIGYCGIAWLAVWLIVSKRASMTFLVPLALAGVIALLLTMPKFLPQLGLGTIARGRVQDLTVLTPSTLATLVLPGYPGLAGVFSLNILFVPAAVILLASLVSLRRPIVRAAVITLAVALVLAVPQSPVRALDSLLPGIASSRFRLNDYLPVLFLAAVIGAMSGLERIHGARRRDAGTRRTLARVGILWIPLALAIAMLKRGRFTTGDWVHTFVVLAVTTVCITILAVAAHRLAGTHVWRVTVSVVVIALSAASGYAYASTVRDLWSVDTMTAQRSLWGVTSGELIAQRGPTSTVERPARVGLAGGGADDYGSRRYLAGFYTGRSAVGGYFSVHQSASYVAASQSFSSPTSAPDAIAFWSAPGIVIPTPDLAGSRLPSSGLVASCVASRRCGDISVTPVAYSAGHLVYSVVAERASTIVANEAYYRGWRILLTGSDAVSRTVAARLGPSGAIEFDLPAGSWQLSMTYVTPLEAPSRGAFTLGLLGLMASVAPYKRLRIAQRRVHHTH